ncbi:hypothetical protein Purlil1_1203 [Purpureocillium lilacinum]|uniref:Uncharacterized protein n=1 Tax=Purpureocillium lilacinum TaxID=33203 RepID=A0ABR0CFA8_PURLI|nr:hypothetical protein Purlil1_1203 [Purpureocillium lilacinum]
MGLRSILRSCYRPDGAHGHRLGAGDDAVTRGGRRRRGGRAAEPDSPPVRLSIRFDADADETGKDRSHPKQRQRELVNSSSPQHGEGRRATAYGSASDGPRAQMPVRIHERRPTGQCSAIMDDSQARHPSNTQHAEPMTGTQAPIGTQQSVMASSCLWPVNVNTLTNPPPTTGPAPSVQHGNPNSRQPNNNNVVRTSSTTSSVSPRSSRRGLVPSPLLRRIAGSSTPMTRTQVREVIATIGQLFPHIPYAVCGHSAMMWYGDTPLKRPAHVSLVCPPDSLAPLLRWAVAKGLPLCDRWESNGNDNCNGGTGGGEGVGFCVPTAADGIPRPVRVRPYDGFFTTLRALPAKDAFGACILTLPCLADAVATDYVRALGGGDYRAIVLRAGDVFWLLRKMAALKGGDERQALTPERAPMFASARFLQPFTASHVYSVDLLHRAGLDLSKVPGLALPSGCGDHRLSVAERGRPSEPEGGSGNKVRILSSRLQQRRRRRRQRRGRGRRAPPARVVSADLAAGHQLHHQQRGLPPAFPTKQPIPVREAASQTIPRHSPQQPGAPCPDPLHDRDGIGAGPRHGSALGQDEARAPRPNLRLSHVGHFLCAVARFHLMGEIHSLKRQVLALEALHGLRSPLSPTTPQRQEVDTVDPAVEHRPINKTPPPISQPIPSQQDQQHPRTAANPLSSSPSTSTSTSTSTKRHIHFDALTLSKPILPRRRSCYTKPATSHLRPPHHRGTSTTTATTTQPSSHTRGGAPAIIPARPTGGMPLSQLGSIRRSRAWPSVKREIIARKKSPPVSSDDTAASGGTTTTTTSGSDSAAMSSTSGEASSCDSRATDEGK